MSIFGNGGAVWHQTHGYGTVRKTHGNGRVSVAFESHILPKTVDPDDLQPWDEVFTGSDYE